MLTDHRICLLAVVWQEFNEIMPELANEFSNSSLHKIHMKNEYRECAATIAEQADSGFEPRPYDSCSDLYTASICRLEGRTLLTADDNVEYYGRIQACNFAVLSSVFSP